MDIETIKKEFPKIVSALDEEIDDLRYLLVIDVNYDSIDDDEFDVFDPEEYNYLLYITERLQNIMGEELLGQLPELLEKTGEFEEVFASEPDLYGIKIEGDEEKIARIILTEIESRIS